MNKLYTQFDPVFFEKTRLSILTILSDEGRCSFSRIKEVLHATDGGIYSHLEKLAASDYIIKEKMVSEDSMQTYYQISGKGRRAFREYISFLESLLSARGGGEQ